MMYDERTLCELVARHTGMDAEKVTPYTTLRADLGLDGAAASSLLEEYTRRFQVDADDLWMHWEDYFTTSGITLNDVVVLLAVWVVADALLLWFLPLQKAWIVAPLDLALLAVWFLWRRVRHASRVPTRDITVGDLYAAIEGKRLRLRRGME